MLAYNYKLTDVLLIVTFSNYRVRLKAILKISCKHLVRYLRPPLHINEHHI